MSEKHEKTITESLQFASSRLLQYSKLFSLTKTALEKQLNLIDFSLPVPLKVTALSLFPDAYHYYPVALHVKCRNTEFFLVRIFL